MIYYNNAFNQNELYVLILLLSYIIIIFLPKRFPPLTSLLFLLFGIAVSILLDHIIGTPTIDFYDVNDTPKYDIYDFLLYCAYGPFSYMMVYYFDKFNLKKQYTLFYIPLCAGVALLFEIVGAKLNVFHYKNGYKILYSLPIYLAIYSILFILYFKLYKSVQLTSNRR